jgi:hypothetical protein
MSSPAIHRARKGVRRKSRIVAVVVLLFGALGFWFITAPRIALVPKGPLQVADAEGRTRTVASDVEFVVVECKAEKSQTYPVIELADGEKGRVIEGPYLLRRGPLWKMGFAFARIPFGCT